MSVADQNTITVVIALIALIFTACSTRFTAITVKRNAEQAKRSYKINTLEYVTTQFDRLSTMGSREELRRVGDSDPAGYANGNPHAEQLLLEYIYVLNRIGAGIYTKALDEEVVFNTWSPEFFATRWQKFQKFVERECRVQGNENGYSFFRWLGATKCADPELQSRYPTVKNSDYPHR